MKGLEEKMRGLIGLWKALTACVPRALCALEKAAIRHTGERRRQLGAASEPAMSGVGSTARRSGRDNHEAPAHSTFLYPTNRSVSPGPNRKKKREKKIRK